MDHTILKEENALVTVIKKEAILSDHNEPKPVLMQQNFKEEMDEHVISMFGEGKDCLELGDEDKNFADVSNFYVKEEICTVKEEDALTKSFKSEANIYDAQDIKFSIDIKEHNINHLVNDSNISSLSGCDTVCTGGSRKEIKPTDKHKAGLLPQKNNYNEKKNYKGNLAVSVKKLKTEQQILTKNTGMKEFKCGECFRTFSRLFHLKLHIDSVHNKFKIECQVCNKKFSYPSNLKKHFSIIHKGKKNYLCEYCGGKFSIFQQLQRHVNNVHLKIRNYKCEKCNRVFSTLSYLKRHIDAVHKGIKKHQCELCNIKLSGSSYLKKHINVVHKGIKNFKCQECGYKFYRLSEFTNHIKFVHTLSRDNKCKKCHKSFPYVYQLKRHIDSVHEKIKNYECPICHKKFSVSYNLKGHISTVHERKKCYLCDECGMTFVDLRSFRSHINTVH